MKILMTADSYLPSLGGGEYHVYYLQRELERMGHQVTLFTFQKGSHPEDGNRIVRVPYTGIAGIPRILGRLWSLARSADLIHAHYSYRLSFFAAVIAFLQRKPLIVTQHGLGLLPQTGESFLQGMAFRLWRWWSMTVSRIVISTSDDLSVDIRQLGFGKKIVHIPNGYDPMRFAMVAPPQNTAPVLLTVRRLVPKTGIQYLIAALPAVRAKRPGVRCIFVGDGRIRPELETMAQTLGVRDCVEFAGAVDHEQVMQYYKQADIVVFPSTAESTSLACIEAMALGKIVVASRVGGLIELLGPGEERGYLAALTEDEHCDYRAPMTLPPERIACLSDAILRAIADTDASARRAHEAARYAAEHFGWPHLASRTVLEAYATAEL